MVTCKDKTRQTNYTEVKILANYAGYNKFNYLSLELSKIALHKLRR